MKKVLILGGGYSKERTISLITAKSVFTALKKRGYKTIISEPDGKLITKIRSFKPNVVFNALHGRFGEDGYIQAMLEAAKVKYTHSGVVASYIAMDKELSKKIRVNLGMRFVDPEGKLLLDWPRPQEIGPNGWYASYRFHQPDLEHILRMSLSCYENVETRSNSEVFSVKDQEDKAIVYFKDLTTGTKNSVNTKYFLVFV